MSSSWPSSPLLCRVCTALLAVNKRGPVLETCGRRCTLALALHQAYRRGVDMPITLLKMDIAAKSFEVRRAQQRRQRFQEIIDGMLTGVLPRRR